MNKRTYLTSLILGASLVLSGAAITFGVSDVSFTHAVGNEYSLTLSSSDAYASGSSKKIKTANGSEVGISYFNCASLSSKHALINTSGTIGNSEIIHSITGFKAIFTGPLQVRYSLNQTTWTDFADVTSGTTYEVSDAPYYFQVKANGGDVSLEEIKLTFSCEVNPKEGQGGSANYAKVKSTSDITTGDYLIVEETRGLAFNGALTSDQTMNTVPVTIENETIEATDTIDEAHVTIDVDDMTIQAASGKYIGSSTYTNQLQYNNSSYEHETFAIDVGNFVCEASSGTTLRFNSATDQLRFRYYKSGQTAIQLYKKGSGGSGAAIVGITADDTNKNSYNENSIFANENSLVVKSVDENGKEKALSSSDYSYIIKNPNGNLVNPNNAFGGVGTYKLIVSYLSFTPVEISLTVGRYETITGITAHMAKTSFISNENVNLASNLTVDTTWNYSDKNETGISYSNLASKGLGVKLLDSSSGEVSLSGSFPSAGTYRVKVYLLSNESICDYVTLTVNPVAVTSISLDKVSLNIGIGESSTLVATVLPNDATNKAVTWSTSSSGIATVSNGVVTGKGKGSCTITATTSDGGLTATCSVTVSEIAVSGITLDQSTASISVGGTVTLTPTISPSNATNKNVNWSTSSAAVATVNGGVVTGVSEGSAVITATTVNSGKTATCTVTVTASSGGSGELVIRVEDVPATYTATTFTIDDYEFAVDLVGNSYTSGAMQWKKQSSYIYNETPINGLQSITIGAVSGKSFSGTLYSGTTAGATTHSQSASSGNTYTITAGDSYFMLKNTAGGAGYTGDITITYSSTPVNPTGISLNSSSLELKQGGTAQLEVNYSPSNCNTNKGVTWTSSNTNIATVDNTGKVTVNSAATIGAKATITATSTYNTSFKATCSIKVVDSPKDAWTVMIYMCGSNLESDSSLATGDIDEILSVRNKPDDVNIIIETGGATSWDSKYGISATKLQRWHVSGTSLVKDQTLDTYTSMTDVSTLESYLEYGIENYPAEKMGLIFWNHGGAMDGVCFDDVNAGDNKYQGLTTYKVKSAFTNAFNDTDFEGKFEFIGYDACLMALQEVALFDSQFANYMVASQETESGYGWDYDTWVDDLYAKKSTTTILNAIVSGFISENGGSSRGNNQTLSVLDLNNMDEYSDAFESLASILKTKITNKSSWTTFKNVVNQAQKFGYDSEASQYNGGYAYDIFDVQEFITYLGSSSTYASSCGTALDNLQTALDNLVEYAGRGGGAGTACGLCLFCPISGYNYNMYATANYNGFTTWVSIIKAYGSFYK